jgi:hypothetical protein
LARLDVHIRWAGQCTQPWHANPTLLRCSMDPSDACRRALTVTRRGRIRASREKKNGE